MTGVVGKCTQACGDGADVLLAWLGQWQASAGKLVLARDGGTQWLAVCSSGLHPMQRPGGMASWGLVQLLPTAGTHPFLGE